MTLTAPEITVNVCPVAEVRQLVLKTIKQLLSRGIAIPEIIFVQLARIPQVYYCTHKNPQLYLILSQLNPMNNEIHFNIIFRPASAVTPSFSMNLHFRGHGIQWIGFHLPAVTTQLTTPPQKR